MAKTELKQFIKEEARVGKSLSAISELVKERSLGLIDEKEVFTIVEDVNEDTEYGYYSGIEGVTRKDAGCGMQAIKIDAPVRTGKWTPVPLRVQISECYNTLENTMLQTMLAKGIKKLDISQTDYCNFLVDLVQGAIQTDFKRLAIFGNKTHSVVGSGSGTEVLKTGVLPENYNLLNGLFASMEAMVTTDTSKRVEIEENTKNTYAEQRGLAPDRAYKVFTELIDKADPLTFTEGAQPIFLTTYSMAKNLSRYMRNEFRNELTLSKVESGYLVGEFEGIKVVASHWLDSIIQRDFNNGTKWNNPHRVLLIDRAECQLGVDSMKSLQDFEVEYIGGKEELVYIKAAYRADFQRVIGTLGAAAY